MAYIRRHWVNGEVITDEKLNNIEEGISEAKKAAEDATLKLDNSGDDAAEAKQAIENHIADDKNPHGVTAAQVGLGDVPNRTTNDQTPTYNEATTLAELQSGEKMSVAFGKIKLAVKNLITHLTDQNNPHQVTAKDVGLGSVSNVSTNDQTPTYSEATTLATLTSGEKLSVAFGKIKLALTHLINHLSDTSNPHTVTASQLGAGTFPATGVCAKTGTDYSTPRIRNIKASTTNLTAGSSSLSSGDVYYVYT